MALYVDINLNTSTQLLQFVLLSPVFVCANDGGAEHQLEGKLRIL